MPQIRERVDRVLARVPDLAGQAVVLVVVLTVIGFALRYSRYGQSVFGDELSTLWIVRNNGLSGVISTVRSDAEITPPLYFVLAWFASKLGSSPELVRLPALIASVLTIPAIFVLGRRLIGTKAALIATAVTAFSPFLINQAGEGRNYSTLVLLLVLSTIFLLRATDTRRLGWWAAYAISSCLILYLHYTAVFYLLGQFLWVLWFFPADRIRAVGFNLIAAVGFIPWIGGFLADGDSPTTKLVGVLNPLRFDVASDAVLRWTVSSPFNPLSDWSEAFGDVGAMLVIAALLLLVVAGLLRFIGSRQGDTRGPEVYPPAAEAGLVLILLLVTPVGELLYSLVTTNIFGDRNLTGSWPGLVLFAGMLVMMARPVVRVVGGTALVTGYAILAIGTLSSAESMPDYQAAAQYVESNTARDDVVVDVATLQGSPTPLTPLDAYLEQVRPEYRLGLPPGAPPFYFANALPEGELWKQALTDAKGKRLAIVEPRLTDQSIWENDPAKVDSFWVPPRFIDESLANLPDGYEVVETKSFPGIIPIRVTIIQAG